MDSLGCSSFLWDDLVHFSCPVQDDSQDVSGGQDDTGSVISMGDLIAQQDPSALPFALAVSTPASGPALAPAPGPLAATAPAPGPAPLGAPGRRLLQDSSSGGDAAGKSLTDAPGIRG